DAGVAVVIPLSVSDTDGDSLTVDVVTPPSGATVTIDDVAATATYLPLLGTAGTQTFTLAANDGVALSGVVTVAVDVTAADFDPVVGGLLELVNDDFQAGVTGPWTNTTTTTAPADGSRGFLGQFGNGTVSLPLSGIPAHSEVTLSFDLYLLNSWDGSGGAGPDLITVTADETTLLSSTFSNVTNGSDNGFQSYPAPYNSALYAARTGATEAGTLGGTFYGDSVYEFTYTFGHSDSTLQFNFSASGLESVSNESWGLDNVVVTTQHLHLEEDFVTVVTLPGSDAGGEALTFTVVTPPSNGSISVSGNEATYTPTQYYSGTDSFGYTVSDATTTTPESTVAILIDALDSAPVFDTIGDVTLDEDSAEQTITITNVGPGGNGDEDAQTVSLTATSFSTARISSPTITGTGDTRTLTFTPVPDAAGSVTLVATATDTGSNVPSGGPSDSAHINTKSQQFAITVTALNDAPEFDAIADVTMDEDAAPAPITITGVGTGGGADEASQTVTFTATSDREDIVPVPTFSGSGDTRTLTFAPVAEANGSAIITVTATDDGGNVPDTEFDTLSRTFTITVDAVNDSPAFDEIATQVFGEDAGPLEVPITGVTTGGGTDETGAQTVTFVATSSLPTLIPDPTFTGSGATRTISLDSVTDESGSATITVTATDDGGVVGGLDVDAFTQSFTVLVTAVNDAPLFDDVLAVSVEEDAGSSTVDITGVGPGGGADEASQGLLFTATSSDTSIVPNPSVGISGDTATATFTPTTDANGTATITLTLTDSGSSTGSHVNTQTKTFDITVDAVNDAPVFDVPDPVTVEEDSGAASVAITNVAVGGGADESSSQVATLTATSSTPSIIPDPTVSGSGPTWALTYAPVADEAGVVTITVVVDDGGPTEGVSDVATTTQTFDITVAGINDAPTLSAISDITIDEDAGLTLVSLGSVGPGGGSDEASQTVSFSTASFKTSVIPSLSVSAAEGGYDLSFTPVADANGVVTMVVSALDDGSSVSPNLNQTQHAFTATVTPIDDAPSFDVISDVTASEDSDPVAVLISNVSAGPADESSQTVTLSATSSDATLIPDPVVTGSGDTWTLTFQPAAAANGAATITVAAADDGSDVSPHANAYSQDFIITVVPVNDTSTADSTTSTTDEDVAVSIPLTGTDLDGDLLSFLLWDGQGGVLTDVLSLNGGVVSLTDANPEDNAATATYTPAADFYGDDTFLFIVSDGTLDSATATVTITVDPLPDVPIATDAAVTTPEETAVDVVLTGLDPDGDPVTVLLFDGEIAGTADITSLNGGTVSISGTADDQATATYTPPAQFSGVDTFEFVVNDAVSDSLAATVTVTVEAVNDPPTVAAVTATTAEDTPASIPLTGDDLDGDLLTVLLWDRSVGTELDVTSVNGGIVSIAATGENAATATYTPPQDFVGSDTFEYIANDGSEDSAAATATVTVTAVNDAPAVSAVTATTAEDTPVDVPLVGLDVDGDALTLLLWDVEFTTLGPVTTANGGTVEVGATTADQAIATYTPATDFVGTDTFEFLANDGVLDGEVATVTVTVEAVNDAPSATAASGATAEDTPVAFDLTGSDIDGDAIVVLLWDGAAGVTTDVSSANGGVVSIGATSGDTATVTYTPVADFSGSDTFEFIVSDGVLDSATAVATITVDPVDDPPVADDPVGPFAVTETTTLDITLTGTDIDSEAVSFSFYDGVLPTPLLVLTTANGGQLVLVDGDAFDDAATATYSPPAGFDGIDSFEFVVEDETSQSAPVSVSISVASTNDAPAASATTASTSEGTPVDISLTGTDVDGNVLTVLLWDGAQGVVEDITSANGGLVSLGDADPSDSIATATYTPGADYSGTDTFEFVV
ncbi:tandem-95 repeat protein, partial [Candidatus Poribacteria bacterium]|nr:tandem-95 repeat protein [Candidatus Poribacteria bacterium]